MSTATYTRASVSDQISVARSAIERAASDAELGRQLSNNPEQFFETAAAGDINVRTAGSTIKLSEILLYVPFESRVVVAQALISRLAEFNETESQIAMTAKPAFPVTDVWLALGAAVAVVDVAVVVEFAVADRKDSYEVPREGL